MIVGEEANYPCKLLDGEFKIVTTYGHDGLKNITAVKVREHILNSLLIEEIGVAVHSVHRHHHFICDITPPLSALSVGAIHKVVAHSDVKGAEGFLPQSVQKLVVAVEIPTKFAVVAGFTILQ